MRKKLLVSLTAMLAVVGLAFAATEGFDASGWWSANGGVLSTKASSLTSSSITAQQYLNIKNAVAAYELLAKDADDLAEVLALTTYDEDGLEAQAFILASKNTDAARGAVNAMKDQINGMDASAKKAADRSDLEELQNKLADKDKEDATKAQWGAVKADFADFAAAYDALVAKVADALLYVTADEWVAKVNVYAFDKTAYASQKTVVEGYQTGGQALVKQTEAVKAALSKIADWIEQYDAQAEQDKQAADRVAFYTALDELSGLNFEYTLNQEDVDGTATTSHYVILTNLKNAWYYLSNDNSDDESTWKPATAGIKNSEIALAQDMLDEWQAMTDAITYLQAAENLYYDTTPTTVSVTGYETAKNDYAKIMQVKADVANNATKGVKYINQLYTETKINTLYAAAKTAFQTYDQGQYEAEAVAAFKTKYATILAADNAETEDVNEAYVAEAADYGFTTDDEDVQTATKTLGVRAAIIEFQNDVKKWNVANTYRNQTYGGAADEAWEISADTMSIIGTNVYNTLNTEVYPALQALIKSAAEKMVVEDLLAQLNTIYTENYVDASAEEGYDEEAVIALKKAKADKAGANTSAANIGYKTVPAKASTNTYATKDIQFWMWDADNNVIAEKIDLAGAQSVVATVTKASDCWGYDLVVNKFRMSEEYTKTQKVALKAMSDAATYLVKYESLIWPTGEITSDMATLAAAGKKQYTTWDKGQETPVSKTDATLKYPTYAKILAYINPIVEQMCDNYDEATDDVETITGTITLYQGTATKKVLESDAKVNKEEALCYTSKKALAAKVAEVPNTIAYIEQELSGDLPTNVACWVDATASTKTWRATDIKVENEQNFYFKYAIEAETATLHKVFTEYYRPFYCPFDINDDALETLLDEGFKVRYLNGVVENQAEGSDECAVTLFFKNKKAGDILNGLKPYIIKAPADAQGEDGYDIVVYNTKVSAVGTIEGNVQTTTTETTYTLYGTSKTTPIKSLTDYMMTKKGAFAQLKNDSEGKVQTLNLAAGCIRLNVKAKSGINYIIRANFEDGDDDATAIEGIEIENQSQTNIYTINGQKVSDMSKPGLYIVNGKKVLVK